MTYNSLHLNQILYFINIFMKILHEYRILEIF